MTRENVGTVEDLHESATRITGLDDFGEPSYREGLAVLLESYERDAGLTPFGRRVKRAFLRGALVARLLSEASWKRFPASADVPIERPVFVTGLPRTGTTALHRLLTADPAHQGLEVWLTEVPQPRPPRDTWESDPVFQRIQAGYEQHHVEHPEFLGAHEMSAEMVEECWQLLRQSAKSVSYECLAYLPTYSAWLAEASWQDAYARHKRNLQLIGLPDKDKRWVLKNPSHLFALDALMAVYPDALVIQTHRAPRTIIASVCSLNEQASADWSTVFHGPVIGRAQLDLWARGASSFLAARSRYPRAQFYDVYYDDFVRDPLGTVESIYRHFGMPFSDDARAAMAALDRQSASRPGHRYSLDDFGLTESEVDDRFADYLAAHPL